MIDYDPQAELNAWAARTLPRPPRFRYFQKGRGPMFCWTTEQLDGQYGSMVMLPVGAGSRSGKAEEWQLEQESISAHELRKDAKARALRLYDAYESGESQPW